MSKASSSARAAPQPLRGEIWEISLVPSKGREQRGVYPCLIVSTDGMNKSNFGTVVVCPIATTHRPAFNWRPGLEPSDLRIADTSWEAKRNWVETDQIVTIDTASRAIRHLATITNREKLDEVNHWLRTLLSL